MTALGVNAALPLASCVPLGKSDVSVSSSVKWNGNKLWLLQRWCENRNLVGNSLACGNIVRVNLVSNSTDAITSDRPQKPGLLGSQRLPRLVFLQPLVREEVSEIYHTFICF